jgi:hypothetical protein
MVAPKLKPLSVWRTPTGWRGTVELPAVDGRRRRADKTGPTKRAVVAKLEAARASAKGAPICYGLRVVEIGPFKISIETTSDVRVGELDRLVDLIDTFYRLQHDGSK